MEFSRGQRMNIGIEIKLTRYILPCHIPTAEVPEVTENYKFQAIRKCYLR